MTPEKRVQNAILKYLSDISKTQHVMFERRQAGGFSYKKGIPDIYVVVDGIHVEIEVKRPGGQLSVMQEKFRDRCAENNCLWICADNVEDVKNLVNKIINKL